MKRKFFTLLLAMFAMSAFQTNAHAETETPEYWIKVDVSGLDSVDTDTIATSYPKKKSPDEKFRWLSVFEGKDSVYVKTGTNGREIYTDPNNKFKVTVPQSGGLQFTCGEVKLVSYLDDDASLTRFEILQFEEDGKGEIVEWNDQAKQKGIEGYLAYPNPKNELKANSAGLALAGIDNTGRISFKYFSEFGAYFTKYGYYPWKKTVLNPTREDTTHLGRLYRSVNAPRFQTYDTINYSQAGTDSELTPGGHIFDWATLNGPSYSGTDRAINYYNFSLDGDSIFIEGNEHKVHLDYIVTLLAEGTHHKSVDTTSTLEPGRLYIKNNNGELVVTALRAVAEGDDSENEEGDDSENEEGDDSENEDMSWTNGEPEQFKSYLNNPEGELLYFYIDNDNDNDNDEGNSSDEVYADMKAVLKEVFGYNENKYFPDEDEEPNNEGEVEEVEYERYFNKDTTGWTPLYVKVTKAYEAEYEYVDGKWLQDRNYDLASVTQKLIDADDKVVIGALSGDSTTVVSPEDNKKAQFSFEKENRTWGVVYQEADDDKDVQNINLFRIKNDKGNYLTVLDTTIFPLPTTSKDSVENTQLGWNPLKKGNPNDSLRQLFAIIYDKKDSILSFLPVASHQWNKDKKYNKAELVYNKNIGQKREYNDDGEKFFAFDSVWHIAEMKLKGFDEKGHLVISEEKGKQGLWFKTDLDLKNRLWSGTTFKDSIVVITRGTEHYHPEMGWIKHTDATLLKDSIRSHWFVDYAGENVKRGGIELWKFTPVVDSIYENPVKVYDGIFKDTLIALKSGNEVKFTRIDNDGTVYRDKEETAQVGEVGGEFSLFLNIDTLLADSSRSVSIRYRGSEASISLGDNKVRDDFLADIIPAGDSVLVHKSNIQYLGQRKKYAVPYYTFSTRKDGTDYFLKVQEGNDSVLWVPSKDDGDEYKFCLPLIHGNHDSVYLQKLISKSTENVIFLKNDGDNNAPALKSDKLDVKDGIYGAIEYYGNASSHKWTITGKGKRLFNEWVQLDAETVEDADALMYNRYSFAYLTPVCNVMENEDVNYGILVGSTVPTDAAVKLILQYKKDTVTGYNNDPVWLYSIAFAGEAGSDTLYLTDATGSGSDYAYSFMGTPYPYAYFAEAKDDTEAKDQFGLKRKSDTDTTFAVVSNVNNEESSSAYRYLCEVMGRLVFVNDSKDYALYFNLGPAPAHVSKPGTGIKTVGSAPAKIYGVAGGVKVANATGAVSVYTIDGRLVTSVEEAAAGQTIAVPAGIYVVKNGATVGKVVVR